MSATTVTPSNSNLPNQQQSNIPLHKKSDFWQSRLTQNGILGMSWGEFARKVGAVFLFTLAAALMLYAPIAVGLYIGAAALLCSKAVVAGFMIAIPLTLVGIAASTFGGIALWSKKDENVDL